MRQLSRLKKHIWPVIWQIKYDVSSEECAERANKRMQESTVHWFMDTISGYTTCLPEKTDIRLRKGKISDALLPVWVLSTKYKDEIYTFAMDGQTGKFVGNLPMDNGTVWKNFWRGICCGVYSGVWSDMAVSSEKKEKTGMKKIRHLFLLLFLLLMVGVPVYAENPDKVVDDARTLLTDKEEEKLEARVLRRLQKNTSVMLLSLQRIPWTVSHRWIIRMTTIMSMIMDMVRILTVSC